jgi:hypothetical protein
VVLGDEDVAGLDVAVDDAARVHPCGGRQQLPHHGAHRRFRERQRAASAALLLLAKEVGDAGADVLHHQVEVRAGRVADELVEADDEQDVVARREERLLTEHNRVPRTRRDSPRSDSNTLLPKSHDFIAGCTKSSEMLYNLIDSSRIQFISQQLTRTNHALHEIFLKILRSLHACKLKS